MVATSRMSASHQRTATPTMRTKPNSRTYRAISESSPAQAIPGVCQSDSKDIVASRSASSVEDSSIGATLVEESVSAIVSSRSRPFHSALRKFAERRLDGRHHLLCDEGRRREEKRLDQAVPFVRPQARFDGGRDPPDHDAGRQDEGHRQQPEQDVHGDESGGKPFASLRDVLRDDDARGDRLLFQSRDSISFLRRLGSTKRTLVMARRPFDLRELRRHEPDLARDRKRASVLAEECGAREQLATILAERPPDDHTVLVLLGEPVDPGAHPAEQGAARPGPPTAYAPVQSIEAHTISGDTACATHVAATMSARPGTHPG